MTGVPGGGGSKVGCGVIPVAGLLVSPGCVPRDRVAPRSAAWDPRRHQGSVPMRAAPRAFDVHLGSGAGDVWPLASGAAPQLLRVAMAVGLRLLLDS